MFRYPKIRSAAIVTVSGALAFVGVNLVHGNEKFFKEAVMPTIQLIFNAEQAHNLTVKILKHGFIPDLASKHTDDSSLNIELFGQQFSNPIGCAAGLDKHGEAMHGLFKLGFGFVEIGSVTRLPQEGNQKPRVFRLTGDKAIINRYGFNSDGYEQVLERIKNFRQHEKTPQQQQIVGINLGKNKTSIDYLSDYLEGLKLFSSYASYIVINVSSPNTPGLRSLQTKQELETILDKVLDERSKLTNNTRLPILVKIAPDLNDSELKDIASIVTRKNKSIDGLIITNTTITRPPGLISNSREETGGLSGRPLKNLTNEIIKKMFKLTEGKIPIIGVGGVESGADALEKIKCGSSLVQLYTALIYDGPPLVNRIKRELEIELKKEGFKSIQEAIGFNSKAK